jgi:hypothetical protein
MTDFTRFTPEQISQLHKWIKGDLSFLPELPPDIKTKKEKFVIRKRQEDVWGQGILKELRPDIQTSGQWTTLLGEMLAEYLYGRLGYTVSKPVKKENYQPDRETRDFLIEVKTQTYFTDGTAGEKILGVPFKYACLPELYGKPVKILCIGGAEKRCREEYGNLGEDRCAPAKKKMLDFYGEMGFEYVAASDLLKES